jgi:hypothetical protein
VPQEKFQRIYSLEFDIFLKMPEINSNFIDFQTSQHPFARIWKGFAKFPLLSGKRNKKSA